MTGICNSVRPNRRYLIARQDNGGRGEGQKLMAWACDFGGGAQWLCAALLSAIVAMPASAAEGTNRYDTSYATLQRIAVDLHRALPAEKREGLLNAPVLLENIKVPYLQPSDRLGASNNLRGAYISKGLIDVLNYVSHAKAVDQVDSGFFEVAVKGLAETNGTLFNALQPTHPKAWAFNTMNWQMSHFNQMAAGLTAIQMAHHYLGHYKKYAAQLGDSKNVTPLYSVLTPKEWREAVLAGSWHALDCGLAPEGLVVLYDAISRMPQRPAWAIQLMPPSAEVSILRLELNRVEARFFDARTSAREELKWSW